MGLYTSIMDKRPEDMNLKEILVEMKNISELIVDLAYSSILFDSEAMANEVSELEETMDELNRQLTIRALLASRTREDAEQISEILNVAAAINDISDHAQNISEIVSRDLDIHSVISESLKHTDEKIFRTQIEELSQLIGISLRETQFASRIGVTIIAVRRGKRWTYNPRKNYIFQKEDLLITRGTEEGNLILKEIAKGRRSKW
jgi:uncharacterized protein with PhoU and TrkA domain